MTAERTVRWPGLVNGRDLGGLVTVEGRAIEPRRLIRSASPRTLTPEGWRQLAADGIVTIVDLQGHQEAARAPVPSGLMPAGVRHVALPLEPPGFIERWSHRPDRWKLTTPHYYDEFLATDGPRVATALDAIVDAPIGGVLVHCGCGRDRAGLVVAVLLDLLGVDHQAIVDDHWLSYDRPVPVEVEMGKASTLEARPLDRAEHGEALQSLLDSDPATRCYHHHSAAAAVRERLLDRMTAST